ncbi:MAG: family 43 glycosylhydrolase [Rikenellaceae bacterium]
MMKLKKRLFAPILICGAILSSVFALQAAPGEKVKAQKIVTTEYGDISVGILIPDRGMADPHVWIENGRLYVFCGHDKSWEPVNDWIMDSWQLWSTKDLTNWQHEYTIHPTDSYIGDQPNCWAGDLCERNGKYYWFFSNKNINTGVMVADKITGPYTDLLGKPLLEEDLTPVHEYDPEIFVDEEGEYHICFGAGTYYMARLAPDMKSLLDKPRAIMIQDKEGNRMGTGDKPTLFKRNEWYYLVCGDRYSMSKNLYGPYTFQGSMGVGAHCSFFEWEGTWYKIHETSDTNNFYRGIGLQPVYFNEDGTMFHAETRASHPGNGRDFTFESTEMGWHADSGTTLEYDKKKESIKGVISAKGAAIESAVYINANTKALKSVKLEIRNETPSTKLRVGLGSVYKAKLFWKEHSPFYDWSKGSFVEVDIEPNSKKMQQIEVPISQFKELDEVLMQVRIEPATEASSGKWEIDNLIVR